jgi:hypothetical protein
MLIRFRLIIKTIALLGLATPLRAVNIEYVAKLKPMPMKIILP